MKLLLLKRLQPLPQQSTIVQALMVFGVFTSEFVHNVPAVAGWRWAGAGGEFKEYWNDAPEPHAHVDIPSSSSLTALVSIS